jgi:medium-chain acyl-[acyl-carrier-protein] hydrolase
MTVSLNDCLVILPQPNCQTTLRLFCFPYAGGNSSIFRKWSDYLPSNIEVCPIELPGRRTRINSTPFNKLDALVSAIAPVILPYLDKPFAFFGHSLGGLISFELTRFLAQNYDISPVKLFISACRAPQICDTDSPIHTLPEAAFIQELRRLNGTPIAVLENSDLMQLFLPVLRADFSILETYIYSHQPVLECPIVAFGGLQDLEVNYDEIIPWQEQTKVNFQLNMLPGDHFFIHSSQANLLELISKNLNYRVD